MRKTIINKVIIFCVVLMGVYACIDDRGNYDYLLPEEVMPVKIEGVKDTITVNSMDVLKISPELPEIADESKYSFLWYGANAVTAGQAPTRDTLAQTRNLEFLVDYESGTYNLMFEVRNKETNVYVNKKILLIVSSLFGHGWFVLKDDGTRSDFDFVDQDGNVMNNVLQSLGRHALPGKGKKLFYQATGYYHQVEQADGTITTLVNKKAFYVLTDQDMNILNADNMGLFKTFKEAFYEAPAHCKPQNCFNFSRDVYLINAGKMHSIYGMSSNIGKFPYEKTGNYVLADDMIGGGYGVVIWDARSRSFFNTTSSGASLNQFQEQTDATARVNISPREMKADLVRLLSRTSGFSVTAYAVMKNLEKEEYYLADITYNQSAYPFNGFDTIPADCMMPKARVMAAAQIASCIYFAKGNELWVYKNVQQKERETKLLTFSNEQIEFISHFRYTSGVEKFNQVVVVTSTSTGWKLYRFNTIGETPEIEITPAVTPYVGTGQVRDVIFRN